MRTYLAWLLAAVALPLTAYAQEATIKEVHDKPAVHGSIIANLLQEHDNPFTLYPYDTNYVIYTQTSDLNKEAISSYNWSDNARKDEVKFQLSLAFPFWRGILGPNSVLGASYTQKSWWQLSNSGESSPFRETNYEPEVMLTFRNGYSLFGWNGRMTGISLTHQSNGRSDPLSRSWNRVIFSLGLDRENWAFVVRPWYRIKEDAADDNNADIEDFVGRGDAMLVYNRNGHELSLTGRHSLRGGDRSHGSLQFDWGFPINNLLRGHVQVFDGYGESMIDYNHRATYVGVGFALLEWF